MFIVFLYSHCVDVASSYTASKLAVAVDLQKCRLLCTCSSINSYKEFNAVVGQMISNYYSGDISMHATIILAPNIVSPHRQEQIHRQPYIVHIV